MDSYSFQSGFYKVAQDKPLVASLNQVLADSYQLMSLTHLAHWNVRGSGFFALHAAFRAQYEELFAAVDAIAERIRALGDFALGGLKALARTSTLNEFGAQQTQDGFVEKLIDANKEVGRAAAEARDLAEKAKDLETQNLMIERVTQHQKVVWLLKSHLSK
jgi:starvation-inducible DNA-binding protein